MGKIKVEQNILDYSYTVTFLWAIIGDFSYDFFFKCFFQNKVFLSGILTIVTFEKYLNKGR